MSHSSTSDKIKRDVDFLKHEANIKHDFQLVKAGKKVLNLPKHQLYSTTHAPIHNYFINPKNGYSANPFNGSSGFYIDFDINSGLNATFYQFILRFTITNLSPGANATVTPAPLMIEKVSLLKNGSNSLGLDVDSFDIFLFNLIKYYKDLYKDDTFYNIGVRRAQDNCLVSYQYFPNTSTYNNIEIPICLNRSNLLASSIKEQLVLRVYFKPDVIYDAIQNSEIKLSNVSLVMRMQELNNSQLTNLVKQPKFNHMFNKRVVLKYNINKLDAGTELSVPLAGFRNVCSALLLFITRPQNDIKLVNLGYSAHLVNYNIDNVYIVDATGRNIQNNNKQDANWNQYLMAHHFKRANEVFHKLTFTSNNENNGHYTYIPFCADSDSFNDDSYTYSGGYSFSGTGDHVLKFTPKSSYNGNVILNMIAFVPAILEVNNGQLFEELA